MIRGYDRSLYILPFDHRRSYITGFFQWHEPLSAEQTAETAASKQLIHGGAKPRSPPTAG